MARISIQTLCGLVLLSVTALPVSATPVDKFGSTVDYLSIAESVLVNTSGGTPSFNPATSTVVGDTLIFNPSNFSSTSNGGGFDVTDVQLNMTLMGQGNHAITEVQFDEVGDYTLIGSGTAATQVIYALALTSVTVLEVDGVPLSEPVSGSATDPGMKNLVNHSGVLEIWNLSVDFDVEQLLIDENVPFITGATKIQVVLDNQLIAASEAGSFAFVAKKQVGGVGVTVVTIPEPSTAGLLGLFAVGFGTLRRRRK